MEIRISLKHKNQLAGWNYPSNNSSFKNRMQDRITFNKGNNNLDAFLSSFRPSQTSRNQCNWIAVSNPEKVSGKVCSMTQIAAMCEEWNCITETTTKTALGLGVKYNCLVGKWVVFPGKDTVDAAWEIIVNAVLEGNLGHYAKVSPSNHQDPTHVICIYTIDFTDQNDVLRVRNELKGLGFTSALQYKPDVYTYLGVYKNNPWNISPIIYKA